MLLLLLAEVQSVTCSANYLFQQLHGKLLAQGTAVAEHWRAPGRGFQGRRLENTNALPSRQEPGVRLNPTNAMLMGVYGQGPTQLMPPLLSFGPHCFRAELV